MEREFHKIQPVFDEESVILSLGSFPSVKSREGNFFYHHPQNRFWKVLAAVYGCKVPDTIEEKKNLLLENHVAVWDVIESCEIKGSSDSSITNVVPNDLGRILKYAPIRHIYTNGGTSDKLYKKYFSHLVNIPVTRLPSTSPANARFRLEALIEEWKIILK